MPALCRSLVLPVLLCASLAPPSVIALPDLSAKTLLKNVSDADEMERLQVDALLVDESNVEHLLKWASDEDADIRSKTMRLLGLLGSKHIERIRPALLKGLKDVPKVATQAVIAIGNIKDAKSAKFLVPLLEQKEGLTKHYAAEALSAIAGKEAKGAVLGYVQQSAPKLIKTLKESIDEGERTDAKMFLSRMLRSMARVDLLTSPEMADSLKAQ